MIIYYKNFLKNWIVLELNSKLMVIVEDVRLLKNIRPCQLKSFQETMVSIISLQ